MSGLLKSGLHPAASDALRSIHVTADMIGQTVGGAPASAGFHLADGAVDGDPYTAAVDFHWHPDMAVTTFLDRLGSVGFAAWYRNPGEDDWPAGDARHIHAVYAGVPMKVGLRSQIHNFCHRPTLTGLVGHNAYKYHEAAAASVDKVRVLFLHSRNPIQG